MWLDIIGRGFVDLKMGILSNVNVNPVINAIAKDCDAVALTGYGDIWGKLTNMNSEIYSNDVNLIVILVDIEELINDKMEEFQHTIDEWFDTFEKVYRREIEYFIADVDFRTEQISLNDSPIEIRICDYWRRKLQESVVVHMNVHYLDISATISYVGRRNIYSSKLWYIGKIPYSNEGTKVVTKKILSTVKLLERSPKKVLVLDLDNTLWGGVLGECGAEGIALSDYQIGSLYREVQRLIKQIKNTGALLAIISKNNLSDVKEVWNNNPYMLLKMDDFVSIQINWRDKAENFKEIARELNLSLDSMVFIDDSITERENIKCQIPEVVVPDFPEEIEKYPNFIKDVYNLYFRKINETDEDKEKTQKYLDNSRRIKAGEGLSFEEFLVSLELKVEQVRMDDNVINRIVQLHGKTNQFNLTTQRYTRIDIEDFIKGEYKIYAYNVSDKFGDYGIVAVVIVDCAKPEIISFLMSCRVMGKLVENYVINQVEGDLLLKGYARLYAKYKKTVKNTPVENLFDGLGYTIVNKTDEITEYVIDLKTRPKRTYYVKEERTA